MQYGQNQDQRVQAKYIEDHRMKRKKINQPIRHVYGWAVLSVLIIGTLFLLFIPSQAVLGAPVAPNPSYGGFLDE